MTVVAKSDSSIPSPDVDRTAVEDVLDLSEPLLWSDPRFHDRLVQGLENDGFEAGDLAALRDVLGAAPLADLDALEAAVAKAGDPEARPALERIVAHLRGVSDFNSTCYQRKTPEQTRVIQWPNSGRVKVHDPAHYFDIFKDFPTRETHRFIGRDTPIGSAGSCFALRIAHQLQLWGYNYVIEEDDLPDDFPLDRLQSTNYRMAPARTGTLFNVVSMRQMVERAFGEWTPEPILTRDNGVWLDPFRRVKATYDDLEGYLEDRERHTQALRRALSACEVFVLTLGPTEAWKFAHSGAFTSVGPWKVEPTLVRPHNLTVEEHVEELERLLACYERHRPGIKLIISVSPVPLDKTYSSRHHVVEANALSKAKLRLAADEFVRRNPGKAFYFPSYEIVVHGTPNPWEEDRRHVSAEAVGRVMTLFQHMFLEERTQLPFVGHVGAAVPSGPTLMGRARQLAGPLRPHLGALRRRLGL
jgi:hypothetical protein